MPVWCQDEAGPYQAIPQPGASWQPEGRPALRPSEYIRGGTAKLLTLFPPKTGEVRAKGVEQSTNAVLHPWLKEGLSAILEALPEVKDPSAPGRRWTDWGWPEETVKVWWPERTPPPVRLALIWDNLKGHHSPEIVSWCWSRGIALLYTPLGGSWLNLAESVQRILVRRALDGQDLGTPEAVIQQLEATARGWNREPTPFEWGGKRRDRRQRARERRHILPASGGYTLKPVLRRSRPSPYERVVNASFHAN